MDQTSNEQQPEEQLQQNEAGNETVDIKVILPNKNSVTLPQVSVNETFNAIRIALAEFQESAFFTCFKFELAQVEDVEGKTSTPENKDCSEFAILASVMTPTTKAITLNAVNQTYEVKSAREHIKRLRDVTSRITILSADRAIFEGNNGESNDTNDKAPSKVELPTLEKISEPPQIGDFFVETLHTIKRNKSNGLELVRPSLANVIKSIALSGWNPVPPQRRLLGDLLYLEVTLLNEGTLFITASSR